MAEARIEALPYCEDSAALFMPWSDRPWAVFLDSGFPHSHQGRYDIIAADPVATLVTRGNLTEVREGESVRFLPGNPFDLVRQVLGENAVGFPELPFCGGAIGYFGYDLARRLEKLPVLAADMENIPDMAVGIYDWALIVDHQERRSWLVSQGRDPATAARWPHLCHTFSQIQTIGWPRTDFSVQGEAVSNMSHAVYGQAFCRIQHYICEGDCYQVNLAPAFFRSLPRQPLDGL